MHYIWGIPLNMSALSKINALDLLETAGKYSTIVPYCRGKTISHHIVCLPRYELWLCIQLGMQTIFE